MKCRKCGSKAVINMRQHKLALCKDHYLEWVPEQTERFIHKYEMFSTEDRLLVAVSGGKDSLGIWDILIQLGYQADGLYIGLGIDGDIGYSDTSRQMCQRFAQEHNLQLRIVEVQEEYGETIPEMVDRTRRGKGKPCSVCGLTKRHIMNRVARDEGYDVLITGHNLDDEAAVLFGNTLNWLGDYLVRQGPVLEATHPGLSAKSSHYSVSTNVKWLHTHYYVESNTYMMSARTHWGQNRSTTRSSSIVSRLIVQVQSCHTI